VLGVGYCGGLAPVRPGPPDWIPGCRVVYGSGQDWLCKDFQSAEGVTEVSRQDIRQIELSAPRRPSHLADFWIAI